MALTSYNHGTTIIRKIDDIFTDNADALILPARTETLVLIKGADVANVTVYITADSKKDIEDGVADWLTYETVTTAEHIIEFPIAPTAIMFSATMEGAKAWILS